MRRSAGEFDRQADEAAAQVREEEVAAAGRSGSGRLQSGLAAVRCVHERQGLRRSDGSPLYPCRDDVSHLSLH